MPRLTAEGATRRRQRILDAAERCFARHGFHRTTVQAICAEAGVSPGALYLYFDSKEALIAGLVERDRAAVAADFAAVERADDVLGAFAALGRRHLAEEPREKAAVVLSIWMEAARDARVRALCGAIDAEIRGHLERIFAAASGEAKASHASLAEIVLAVADGLIKRRALEDDFNADAALETVMALIRAALSGAVVLPAAPSRSAPFDPAFPPASPPPLRPAPSAEERAA